MNRLLIGIATLSLLLTGTLTHAQRIAFVDTKYILEQMPDYEAAQQELNQSSRKWQDEIDERWSQIKHMREALNAEAILLTDEMKKMRQAEIDKKEREARDLQQKRFGVGGDLFKKREELIRPIQDRVFDAVKDVAGTSYVAIFDIGGVGNNVLYASDKYDKSDNVLRKLGIRPDRDGRNAGNLRGNEQELDRDTPPASQPGRDQMNTSPNKGTPTNPPSRGTDQGGFNTTKPRQ